MTLALTPDRLAREQQMCSAGWPYHPETPCARCGAAPNQECQMSTSISFHARPLTLRRLMPHNSGMVGLSDSDAEIPSSEVSIFTGSVETCARLALAVPTWHPTLELWVKEASRTDPNVRAERMITDHDEIRAWLDAAIREAEAPYPVEMVS